MRSRVGPYCSAKGKGPVFCDCPGGEARLERAGEGARGHLLPTADSISIGVPPQFVARHGQMRTQTLCSSVRCVKRLSVSALSVEHTGLLHQPFDFIRPLSGQEATIYDTDLSRHHLESMLDLGDLVLC